MATGFIPVLSKNYTFDPRPLFPFCIVTKRYWIEEYPYAIDLDISSKTREDVLTLVFMHGNGGHKAFGEPMIQRLFQNQQAATRRTVRFHDMWSLDMPNHGDSAIVNEETLRWGYDICKIVIFHSHEYSLSNVCSLVGTQCSRVHAFLAVLGTGVGVDFSKRSTARSYAHAYRPSSATTTSTYTPPTSSSCLPGTRAVHRRSRS